MSPAKLIGMLSAAASAATLVSYARYRREIRSIRREVESGSTIAETAAGAVEYAEIGEGARLTV